MELRLFGHHWSDWLRACGACGSAFGPVDFFCAPCWQRLHRSANRGARLRLPLEDFPTFALWTWTPEMDPFLRPLIYALKGGWGGAIVDSLAEDMAFARGTIPLRPNVFRVTAPPRGESTGPNHAEILARAFAGSLRSEYWGGLVPLRTEGSEPSAQKRKTAEARRKRQYRADELETDSDEAWVFVDDVVTTGATARAAFEALGQPARFEVWALAWRPPRMSS